MLAAAVLQDGLDVTGGGLVAIVVTLVLAWVLYAVSLHLAATFFVGDVPTQPAAAAALAPAVVSLLLVQFPVPVVLAVTLVADAVAIWYAYELKVVPTVALTLLHLAFATILAIALNNVFGFV